MPTNQQRRDAAKRRLERQLVRRQQMQKSRRQRTIIGGAIAAVVVIAGVIFLVTRERSPEDTSAADDAATSPAAATACTYTDAETTVKAVNKPDNTNPLTAGTVDATITLGQGELPVILDRSLAPCAVNAFISLAAQDFYDDTTCHRLTDAANFRILQCGDPSGTGRGGPGFSYPAEAAPADPAADPAAADPAGDFPVGTLAMAGSPDATNGSQFVIVYGESDLSGGGLTKIGTVGSEGLALVDQIAAKGTTAGPNGATDAPAETVEVTSVTVPDDAVTPTQPPAVTDSAPTEVLPTDAAPSDPAAPDAAATDGAPADGAPSDAAPTDGAPTDSAPTEAAPTGADTGAPVAPTAETGAPTS